MSNKEKIKEAAGAAKAALTNELYHPTMAGLRALSESNLSTNELLEVIPALTRFVAKGMAAQQAADAVIAEFNAKHKS